MTLCSLSAVLDRCSEPSWPRNDEIQITVKPGASVPFDDLRKLKDHGIYVSEIADRECNSQYFDEEPGNISQNVRFTLTVPRLIRKTVVAQNLADLISIDSATQQAPLAYFIVKEEETNKSFCFVSSTVEAENLDAAPKNVKRYHHAIRLWQCLKENDEYTKPDGTLLFFGVRRTQIRPGFRLDDLVEDIRVDEIEQFLNNEEKTEFRKDIFKSVISEFLRDQRPENAFPYLLRLSGLFVQRLQEGWEIFVSKYSPAKLNEEAISKHLELTEKLEKIIGGMEAKSLTIPAAVLLAVKEVQFGAQWTTLNTIIVTASVLYLLAMTVAHFSQRSTLRVLKETISTTTKDLKAQGLGENSALLKESFANLEMRRKISNVGSWAMLGFSVVPLIGVIYAAFWAPPKKPETIAGQYVASADRGFVITSVQISEDRARAATLKMSD